jgi:hypothetical protein
MRSKLKSRRCVVSPFVTLTLADEFLLKQHPAVKYVEADGAVSTQ